MGLVSDLLEKIRAKRQQKFVSVAEQFNAAIGALAKENEVDADNLASMLDELDLSDDDLNKAIQVKRERIGNAAEIERLKGVAKELQKIEAEISKIQGEIDRFLAERKPRIAALVETAKHMRADADRITILEDNLKRLGIPLHLQQRKNELQSRRMAWGARQRQYDDDVKRPSDMVRQYRNRLEVIDEQLRRAAAADHEPLVKSRQEVERELAKHQATIDGLSSDKASLDAERASIEKEEAELNRQLMVP